MLRAAEMAKAAMPKATVINMIQLPGARRRRSDIAGAVCRSGIGMRFSKPAS